MVAGAARTVDASAVGDGERSLDFTASTGKLDGNRGFGLSFLLIVLVVGGIWALADAIRRRADPLWLAVLVLLFPFSWPLYLLLVRTRFGNWRQWVLARIPHRDGVAIEPSNSPHGAQLTLADSLESGERAAEAEVVYRDVLAQDPSCLAAWHGLARALLSLSRPREAVEALERVLVRDRSYRGYGAALDYAEALWQNEQRSDAVEVLESVVALTERLNHRVALAHYLALAEQREAAREVLRRALVEHERRGAPRDEGRWAQRAAEMLGALGDARPPAVPPAVHD